MSAVNTGDQLSQEQVVDLSQMTSTGVSILPPPLSQSSHYCGHDESVCQLSSALSSQSHRQLLSRQYCLVLLSSVRAHQQSINVMRCHGDDVVTASNDHTLKVSSPCCCYLLETDMVNHSVPIPSVTVTHNTPVLLWIKN